MSKLDINDNDWMTWEGLHRIESLCKEIAADEGLSGIYLIMRSRELFNQALNEKPTYKQRNEKWQKEQMEMQSVAQKTDQPDIIDVLRQIADGHNDPRSLAIETLANLGID